MRTPICVGMLCGVGCVAACQLALPESGRQMSRRTEKVASMIRRVIGEAIMHHLNDPRVSPLTSITTVKVTGDLKHADVLISVMGTEGQQRATMAGLNSAHGYLQTLVAKSLSTRQCPTLQFTLDDSIKQGIVTLRLIDEAMAELAQTERDRDRDQDQDQDSQTPPSSSEHTQSGEQA
jgi:ribosome-binding factor A